MPLTVSLLDLNFVGVLCLVGVLRSIWPTRYYALLGALCSLLLVGFAAPTTALVVTCLTIFYLYPLHRLYCLARNRAWSASLRRTLLAVGISGLVALLIIFKLYRYFTIPWLGGGLLRPEVLALIGFSYFLFRAISFLHIQSILDFEERSPWGLLYFTLFPPTITSGPIQKYQDFRQQLLSPVPLNRDLLAAVAYRVTRGYFRKIVIAGMLNGVVEGLLAVPAPTIVTSVATIVVLYLFFYFDFAGYSDIAIGFGLLLGIKVPENFRKPFEATTVSEFWRNYHITLVDWFRDQVFLPLGGMKGSRLRAASLAGLVMIFCGFWHGLTLSFVAWGLWHGSMLFAEAMTGSKPVPPSLRHGPYYWLRVVWTNARVAFGSIFFLPEATATLRLLKGFTHWNLG